MSRYIDAEHLMQKLSRMIDFCEKHKVSGLNALFQVGDAIMDCHTADVVEVVRCKDCKHYDHGVCIHDFACNLIRDDDYCSYGERRERGE